jgi:UDP-glucose 4-epimerase
MNWSRRRVIVTGGAGFIGSALVDRLLEMGASVTVVDKLLSPSSSWVWEAKLKRLSEIYSRYGFKNIQMECMDLSIERDRFQFLASANDVVFHLAAVFGGREFVDIHQSECSRMFAIDHNVISASQEAGIEHLHYSSSACVYPASLNTPGHLLREDDALSTGEGWRSSDNLYGFGKLMGEMQLSVFHSERGFRSSVCRYLTVYGAGEMDASHAIPALVEKALDRQEPYEVWGSGNQERGFTYVDDIVSGSLMATEKISDASPVNLGWEKRYKIRDVADLILQISGHKPKRVSFDRAKPEGPFSRALDTSRARNLGWTPKVDLAQGLEQTVAWHLQQRRIFRSPEPIMQLSPSERKPQPPGLKRAEW